MNIRFGLLVLFIVGCSTLPVVSVLKFSDVLKQKYAISLFALKRAS